MVMVVPVDADVHEAQDVTEKLRDELLERLARRIVRSLQFEHHNRDDDGEHAIAEGFQTAFTHACDPTPERRAGHRRACPDRRRTHIVPEPADRFLRASPSRPPSPPPQYSP